MNKELDNADEFAAWKQYIEKNKLPPKIKCAKCGMVFENITSYYCSNIGCPTFYTATC